MVVHDHLVAVPVGDLRQVAHGVLDGDGAVGSVSGLRPSAVAHVLIVVDGHAEADFGKHVLWLGKQGQLFTGGGRHDDASAPGLGHAIVTGLHKALFLDASASRGI